MLLRLFTLWEWFFDRQRLRTASRREKLSETSRGFSICEFGAVSRGQVEVSLVRDKWYMSLQVEGLAES